MPRIHHITHGSYALDSRSGHKLELWLNSAAPSVWSNVSDYLIFALKMFPAAVLPLSIYFPDINVIPQRATSKQSILFILIALLSSSKDCLIYQSRLHEKTNYIIKQGVRDWSTVYWMSWRKKAFFIALIPWIMIYKETVLIYVYFHLMQR